MLLGLAMASVVTAAADEVRVVSPDGRVAMTLAVRGAGGETGCLVYSVTHEGETVVGTSRLGLDLADAPPLGAGLEVAGVRRSRRDATWRPVYGERAEVPDRWNQAVVSLRETAHPHRRLQVTVRVADEGAAFCYTIPKQPGLEKVRIEAERTRFTLPAGTAAWVAHHAQGKYARVPVAEMKGEAERPLTLELPGGLYAAIAEARLVDYARMRLVRAKEEPNAVVSKLAGPVDAAAPLATPWRVVMVAERPGDLLEHNYLLLNLNPPRAIEAGRDVTDEELAAVFARCDRADAAWDKANEQVDDG